MGEDGSFTSHATIFQLYSWQHIHVQADWRRKYTYGRYRYFVWFFKADMKSYIPLETAAIFFLENLFPKQGISSEYVTVDIICMGLLGLQGAKTENYKMKNSCQYRDSNSRPLIFKSSA